MTDIDVARLLALADRCEAATGPDRGLDAEIHHAILDGVGNGYGSSAPAYTASLDAAITLAEGFILLSLSDIGADGLPLARLGDPSTTPSGEWTGIGATLTLSLCAAALRARATQSDEIARARCPYCLPGIVTGLPGNACENCMNTGWVDGVAPNIIGANSSH